jgi:hypothetical protein
MENNTDGRAKPPLRLGNEWKRAGANPQTTQSVPYHPAQDAHGGTLGVSGVFSFSDTVAAARRQVSILGERVRTLTRRDI